MTWLSREQLRNHSFTQAPISVGSKRFTPRQQLRSGQQRGRRKSRPDVIRRERQRRKQLLEHPA